MSPVLTEERAAINGVPAAVTAEQFKAKVQSGAAIKLRMLIDPALAHWILSRNACNRPMRPSVWKKYAAAMIAGDWHETGEALIFDLTGMLLSGQHRLRAVEESGQAQWFDVRVGITRDAAKYIDTGLGRTLSDSARMGGMDWVSREYATIANASRDPLRTQHKSVSHRGAQLEFAGQHRAALEFAFVHLFEGAAGGGRVKGVSVAPAAAAIVRAFYYVDHAELARFCDLLRTGGTNEARDRTVVSLRDWMIRGTVGGRGSDASREKYLKVSRALRAWLDGECHTKAYPSSRDPFPLADELSP